MFGHESVVGDAHVVHRSGEHTAHRGRPAPSVADASDRVAGIAQRMAAVVEASFGRTVALHERADAAAATPPVGTLATGVRAIDAPSARAVHLGYRSCAHGTCVLADHIAGQVEDVDVRVVLLGHDDHHDQRVWHSVGDDVTR